MTKRMKHQPRRFKVRGQDMVGTEVTRTGDRVTLMCAPIGWPFVRERTFARAELVRLDGSNGDDELIPKADAQPPVPMVDSSMEFTT